MERNVRKLPMIPARPKSKKVAAYARVSSGKDAMLHSLSAQVSYYSSLIQNHAGWDYAGVYADEALTGTKDNRAEFQRLLTACRAGRRRCGHGHGKEDGFKRGGILPGTDYSGD